MFRRIIVTASACPSEQDGWEQASTGPVNKGREDVENARLGGSNIQVAKLVA